MVRIDPEKQRLWFDIQNTKRALEDTKRSLWLYENAEVIGKYSLRNGAFNRCESPRDVLYSESSLEKCVFDGANITIISPIFGGSGIEDSAVYRCKKCKVEYYSPLNARDKKAHDKRMREMVIG